MKLLVMLETGTVHRLNKKNEDISDIIDAERCLVIDTQKLTYVDPTLGDDEEDITPVSELMGLEEEIDEDDIYESDEEADLVEYDDEAGYDSGYES